MNTMIALEERPELEARRSLKGRIERSSKENVDKEPEATDGGKKSECLAGTDAAALLVELGCKGAKFLHNDVAKEAKP